MADQQQGTDDIKKKCAETGKTLKRARWYYRNGKYFVNKNAFKVWWKKQQDAQREAQKDQKAEEAPKPDAPSAKEVKDVKDESKT